MQRRPHIFPCRSTRQSPPQFSELTQRCALFGAAVGRVIWFQDTAKGASTRLLLKTLGDQDTRYCDEATPLADCAVADTFRCLPNSSRNTGLASSTRGSRWVRSLSGSKTGKWSVLSVPWEHCLTRQECECCYRSISRCIPVIGAGVTAGRCGVPRWRGARGPVPGFASRLGECSRTGLSC